LHNLKPAPNHKVRVSQEGLCRRCVLINDMHFEHFSSHMLITRQRLGERIPEVTLSTIGHQLLGNGPINMHSWQQNTMFSVGTVRSADHCGRAV
jgi:hypothetical protein